MIVKLVIKQHVGTVKNVCCLREKIFENCLDFSVRTSSICEKRLRPLLVVGKKTLTGSNLKFLVSVCRVLCGLANELFYVSKLMQQLINDNGALAILPLSEERFDVCQKTEKCTSI